MAKAKTRKARVTKGKRAVNPAFAKAPGARTPASKLVHVYGNEFVCDTDSRGFPTPRDRSIAEIVVDASEGFVPLWAKDTTLRWRFREASLKVFANPAKAATEIRKLLGDALIAWADATPVKFAERNDLWDFEIVVQNGDNCTASGCVLASAFFPDAGRHELKIFPKMFQQDRKEQVETLVHEIGHVFGLRHFFAQISEKTWRSEIFGTHKPFSIMNYGAKSTLTAADKSDLKRLYQKVWSGQLTHINGTPIKLVKPFHTIGSSPGPGPVFVPQLMEPSAIELVKPKDRRG
ncbi:MAG TPA: matrixin family metalloprotease [Vicinamibacterales bacterium]|nr:matrixin family metalloprotease [Vicinamibacterales bacterium]